MAEVLRIDVQPQRRPCDNAAFDLKESLAMHPAIHRLWRSAFALAAIAALSPAVHATKTICTALADAHTGQMLLKQGRCEGRFTPASTFKIAISLMGYDAGFLKDEHAPTLPFKEGYADWGGDNWKQPTDPQRWITYSVVWYSQLVTQSLGEVRFRKYLNDLEYGNRDGSGDPGKNNGLTRAWLSSSLKISPVEQLALLRKIVQRKLPVTAHAMEMTSRLTLIEPHPDGWEIHGKTGSGSPPGPDGRYDVTRAYGWFVGWATKGPRTVVFARLDQDDKEEAGAPGIRARDALLKELPALLAAK